MQEMEVINNLERSAGDISTMSDITVFTRKGNGI